MRNTVKYLLLFIAAMVLASCSTTRVLQDGEYRLAVNKVKVNNDKNFNSKSLENYIQQSAGPSFIAGWHPFISVYNWQNGKGKGWDKFLKKIGIAPVVYNSESVVKSEENINNHLQYIGYFDSTTEGSVAVKGRKVFVTYNVELGKQYPIKALECEVPSGDFEERFLADSDNMLVKEGEPLAESTLEDETVRSTKYFKDNGYYSFNKSYFSFEADTLTYPDSALLKMRILEYPRSANPEDAAPHKQYYFGDVTFTMPESMKMRPKVLSGLNLIQPGDLYCESTVNTTYQRLSSIKVFNSVSINLTESGDNTVDANISLTQSKLKGFKLNFEASTNSSGLFGISPQLSYYHKNIFHGGEWMNLSFMGNFQHKFHESSVRSNEFGVSAGLSLPKFLFLPYRIFRSAVIPRTEFNVSYNFQQRPEYQRDILSASYGYAGSYKEKFSYKLYPLQMNIVHLKDINADFYQSLKNDPFLRNAYQNHFDLGLGATLYYTTNTSTNPKTSYFYSRASIDLSGNLLSAFKPLMEKDENGYGIMWNTPYSQYARFELTFGKTWRFGRNDGQAFATRFVTGAGFAYGNSAALPFEKHFYAGGANSMRGWQARCVGPGSSQRDTLFVIPNQSGDIRIEANAEYRFKLFWKFEGATFVDAGNVWNMPLNYDNEGDEAAQFHWNSFYKSIACNWGLGLRADFNFLVVRVDWGLKLHEPSDLSNPWYGPRQWFSKNGYAIHFGVGYPF